MKTIHWRTLVLVTAMLLLGWLVAGRGEKEVGDDRQGIQASPEDLTPETCMDQINELLRGDDLRGSQAGSEARRQARTRTLRVLEASDPTGRARVLRFLAGAGLVQGVGAEPPIISLGQVDLEDAGLRGIHLGGAYQSSTADSGHIERIPRWF